MKCGQCELIVKFNEQQLSDRDFFNRESSHFESLLPPKSENLRPHPSNSIENATPSSRKSPLASCKGVPPPPAGGYWCANEQDWIHYPYDVAISFRSLLTC